MSKRQLTIDDIELCQQKINLGQFSTKNSMPITGPHTVSIGIRMGIHQRHATHSAKQWHIAELGFGLGTNLSTVLTIETV